MEIGQGVIVRFDQKKRSVVGLTIMGVRAKLVEASAKDILRRAISRPAWVRGTWSQGG